MSSQPPRPRSTPKPALPAPPSLIPPPPSPALTAPATTTVAPGTNASGQPTTTVTTSKTFNRGRKKTDPSDNADKPTKTVATKDTKKAIKANQKTAPIAAADAKLPDKQLYDKALLAIKKGHYDVARLDLQTMLNTYPDSQYQMRAKLAVADSWYKEGGTAALTQAESEYADFRVFFPNVPEAAEAQMRIGDIYFRQMDKPDRDYQKSLHAEEEYRRMLTDYPDSTLIPQAKQRLREVQEVLASRESDIAGYYSTRNNYAAEIARYQTVIDTYPLYSHLDDVLIGLGDAYEAQARYVRGLTLPEGGKAQLETLYDTQAADAYRRVVQEHAASAHVEDARDRLAAMGQPIPEPTAAQIAASNALENSRGTYTISKRATTLFLHAPDTVLAATKGEPTMTDPKPTVAPTVVKKIQADFSGAFAANGVAATPGAAPAVSAPVVAESPKQTPTQPTAPARPLALSDVGSDPDAAPGTTNLSTPAATSGSSAAGSGGVGVEILTPGARANGAPATGAYDPGNLTPATTGAPDPNNGLKAVGPSNAAATLPPVEAAGPTPDRINEVTAPTPAGQTPAANGKSGKPAFDKSDESSSKHKKKKGLKKIVEPL